MGTTAAQEIVAAAAEVAVANVPKLQGATLIALDASGSMGGNHIKIAGLFAAALLKANPTAKLVAFDDHRSTCRVDVVGMRYLTLAAGIAQAAMVEHGGGTNFAAIFSHEDTRFDRVIVLSDMQGWCGNGAYGLDKAVADYRRRTGANPYIYSMDLMGSGTSQFRTSGKVALVAGWSDKVFDVFGQLEIDTAALVKEIDRVALS
jgi:hypothetical protein